MIIQNFNRSYQVMCHLGSTEKTEEFLCSEIRSGENTAYILIRITDLVLAKHLTLFLEEKVKGREFTDYLECFQADGAFYMVFSYSLWETLSERLQTEFCNRKERAEIAKGLLEKLLLLNPHPYFAWNVLNPKQITISRSLEVGFQYHLEQIGRFESYTIKEVGRQLLKVLRLLFAKEEKNHLYPLLEAYFKTLEQGELSSYLELYKGFMTVYEELLTKETENLVSESFWFRLWRRIKKILAFLKKVLAVVIIAVTILYVVRELGDDSASKVMSQNIHQIGELTIESTQIQEQER